MPASTRTERFGERRRALQPAQCPKMSGSSVPKRAIANRVNNLGQFLADMTRHFSDIRISTRLLPDIQRTALHTEPTALG